MTIEEMKQIKAEQGYTYEQISDMSGVPLGTVQKILGGMTKTPRYDTLRALEKFFLKKDRGSFPGVGEGVSPLSSVSMKLSRGYTVEDYYALPRDRRAELIDGVFYDMSAPSFVHQQIIAEVFSQIRNYIEAKKGQCISLMAPVDVRLDCDDRTMVQPDILVLCDRGKIRRWGIMGAPDFLVEILSPATKRKDSIKKLAKYAEAGVREYWLIDPDERKLIVYPLERNECPRVYGLEGKTPLGIFEDLSIDLERVGNLICDYPED